MNKLKKLCKRKMNKSALPYALQREYTEFDRSRSSIPKKRSVYIYGKDGRLFLGDIEITFTRRKDEGDTYNFGAVSTDYGEKAEILSIENYIIKTSFFDVKFYRTENLINFIIEWDNNLKNKL